MFVGTALRKNIIALWQHSMTCSFNVPTVWSIILYISNVMHLELMFM